MTISTDKKSLTEGPCVNGDLTQMFKISKNHTPNPIWLNEGVYIKYLEDPRMCLEAYDWDNTQFYYNMCSETKTQTFKVTKTEDGKYVIVNLKGNNYMNVDGDRNEINVLGAKKNEKSLNQKWILDPFGEEPGIFYFKNAKTGKCAQNRGGGTMSQNECAEATYQGHYFVPVDPTFRSLNSKAASAPEPSTAAKPAGFLQL